MRRGIARGRRWRSNIWLAALLAGLGLALAGCGVGGGTAANGTAVNAPASSGHNAAGASGGSGQNQAGSFAAATPQSSAGAGKNTGPGAYLIKSLEADIATSDPRQSASDIRQWILATDPRAQSDGIDYQRQDDGTYTVQMTFSVEASLYPQVQAYLAGYAPGHQGRLLHLHESVQDVTNQYVDLQSRLTNLRQEQQRLLDLMARSSNLTDTLAIEQRLTDVEGQIEQIEGQQTQLNAQTTYYPVTINLSPLSAVTGTPQPAQWNPGDVLQGAWVAAMAFGEFLANVGIWLGVFAIYIVPVLIIVWLVRRWLRTRKPATPVAP
jgi:hypothetical protein